MTVTDIATQSTESRATVHYTLLTNCISGIRALIKSCGEPNGAGRCPVALHWCNNKIRWARPAPINAPFFS